MFRIQPGTGANGVDCGSSGGVIRFAAEAKGGPERLWFDLRVERVQAGGEELLLELHHVESMLGSGRPGPVHPVWSADGGAWRRLPAGERLVLDDGRIQLRWRVPAPVGAGRLAVCQPYAEAELRELAALPGLRADAIGLSGAGRELTRIANRVDAEGGSRPGVFLLARQHAGEVPGSWVLEGMMRAFAVAEPGDPQVWSLPLVDVDGVVEGRYGKSHWPVDFNRAWLDQGLVHEIALCRMQMKSWAKRCVPAVVLDFHGPGLAEPGIFLFTSGDQEPHGSLNREVHAAAGRRAHADFFRESSYMKTFADRLGIKPPPTAADFARSNFPTAAVATVEVSYQSLADAPADADAYRALGRDLAAAVRRACAVEAT